MSTKHTIPIKTLTGINDVFYCWRIRNFNGNLFNNRSCFAAICIATIRSSINGCPSSINCTPARLSTRSSLISGFWSFYIFKLAISWIFFTKTFIWIRPRTFTIIIIVIIIVIIVVIITRISRSTIWISWITRAALVCTLWAWFISSCTSSHTILYTLNSHSLIWCYFFARRFATISAIWRRYISKCIISACSTISSTNAWITSIGTSNTCFLKIVTNPAYSTTLASQIRIITINKFILAFFIIVHL